MQEHEKKNVATAYSPEQAEVYDQKRFSTPQGKCVHRREWSVLRSALRRMRKGGAALEVGCGTGRLLLAAHALGYRVDGADASPDMLEKLKEKLGAAAVGHPFWIAPADKLPCPDGSYDLTYAIRLLNQTESPAYALRVVREMIRVTKPDGLVLAEFVNEWRPRWGMGKRKTTRLKPSEVVREGERSGATLVRSYGNFFLGMQAFHYSPSFLLWMVNGVDRMLSALFPRLCSRCYVLFRKDAA